MPRWCGQLLRSSENGRGDDKTSSPGIGLPPVRHWTDTAPPGTGLPIMEAWPSIRSFSELRRSWGDHRSISKMQCTHRTSFPGSTGVYTALGVLLLAELVPDTFLS